jgi:ribonuclease BN (tRNA processing enzyme)
MCDGIKYRPHYIEQCTSKTLSNPSKWTLKGHSKAGEATFFLVEQLGIMLDAGGSTYKTIKAIFLSHTHSDHAYALPNIYSRHSNPIPNQPDGRPIYFPKVCHDAVTGLYYAYFKLADVNRPVPVDYREEILHKFNIRPTPVEHFQHIEVPGLNGIFVEVLPAYHSVDSIGYGFYTKKTKLKPEYLPLAKSKDKEDKQKFTELRKSNVEITQTFDQPEFVFFSDSTIENLKNHDEWKKYPVIINECTGFDEVRTPESTYNTAHTHWSHLFPIMKEHKDKEWIVIHTSWGVTNEIIDKYQKIMDKEGIKGYIWKTKINIVGEILPKEP